MKKIILCAGALFFLLMTIPSYAQKTSESQKESKVRIKKAQANETQKSKRVKISSETKESTLPTIHSPTNNSQVSSPLTIKGTASRNAQVEVNIEATFIGGSQDLGTFKANADSKGKWSTTPINLWIPEDAKNIKFQIIAIQTFNNMELTSKTVTVLPPPTIKTISRSEIKGDILMQVNPNVATKKIPQNISLKPNMNAALIKAAALPEITSPNHQAVITTPLTVEGTAKRGSTISVTVESNIAKPNFNSKSVRAVVDENGKWKTAPINLWLFENETDARFTISATEKIPGIDQPLLSKPITVIPSINQNFPRHPVKPKISSISKAGENDASRVIKGSAGPGRTIQIYILSYYTDSKGKRVDLPKVNSSTTSDNQGKWATSPIILPTANTESQLTHNISVNQIAFGQVSGNTSLKITTDHNRTALQGSGEASSSKTIKLKVTLLEIQCAVSKDDDKIDDYGMTQHVWYKAKGKVKEPISTDIRKFTRNTKCKLGGENTVWNGSTALICGNRDRQIQVQESKVTEKRSPNINSSLVFNITPEEANDKNAEFLIDTWIKEYSSTTASNIFSNDDYDNVLNKDPRKMRVAIHDVLAILNGTKELRATNKYFDGDISQVLKFDNFDDASLPLRKVNYSGKTILEGPIRGRMRNRSNNRKAFVWMRFEIID